MSDRPFLSRWSRLKTEARKAPAEPVPPSPEPARPAPPAAGAVPAEPVPLPPIASLTPESDFTPFLREGVEEGLKRAALKTLFRDPRFNVMDGLDVYIDDYSKPDPLPEGWLEKLNQYASLSPKPDGEPAPAPGAETVPEPAAPAAAAPELSPAAPERSPDPAEAPIDGLSSRAPRPDTPAKERPQPE